MESGRNTQVRAACGLLGDLNMKIWIKLFLGTVVGTVLGFVLSPTGAGADIIQYLAKLTLQVGRYLVVPLVFFSLTVAAFELQMQRKLSRIYRYTILYGALSSICLIVLGSVCITIFPPDRIPIIVARQGSLNLPTLQDLVLRVFPANLFSVFIENGDFLLPLSLFALFLGFNLTFDRQIARPVVELFDSFNRVLYHMNIFFTEFLYIAGIALTVSLIIQLRNAGDIGIFVPFLVILGLLTLCLAFVFLPVALYFLRKKKKPFRWLYAQLGPGLTALISGDVLFSYGQLIRHGHETLGVSRKVGAVTYPFLLVFSRSGSALVTVASFLVVFRSYSSLELGFFQTFWVMILSFILSFALWAVPGSGAMAGITLLSQLFGRGLEEGYLILTPVAPLLISFGAFLDILCASLVTLLVSEKMGALRPSEVCHPI